MTYGSGNSGNYKKLKGQTIQVVDADPTVGGIAGSTWASGGALNTARSSLGGAGASNTAGLVFGGLNADATGAVAITEAYNGTSWTEVMI